MATLNSSTLKLYCWTGSFNSQPTTAQYTITKSNPDSNNTVRFELSELIQDFISVTFNDDYNTNDTNYTIFILKINYL